MVNQLYELVTVHIIQLYSPDGMAVKIALSALGLIGSGLGLWICNRRNKDDKK